MPYPPYPEPSLRVKFGRALRSIFRRRHSYWITNCWVLKRYDKHRGGPYGKNTDIGSPEFVAWVACHDRLLVRRGEYQAIIKREAIRKVRAGELRTYWYWRGYMWPYRNEKPVRVYIGKLETATPSYLAQRIDLLIERYKAKRKYYLAERERRRRKLKRIRKARWYRRYKARKHGKYGSTMGGGPPYPTSNHIFL